MAPPEPEEPLAGGNVTGAVRVGATVRKPGAPATDSVLALLTHLQAAGFRGAPRPLGRDDRGRLVLEHVPGAVAHEVGLLDATGLRRVGAIIRRLHDAAASFVPPRDAVWDVALPAPSTSGDRLVCHHDLAPWNLVLGEDRWVFVDWDGAGPGTRLWDLAYAAHGFVGIAAGGDVRGDGARLRVLVDGYGLDSVGRTGLVDLLPRRIAAMHDLLVEGHRTGRQPWARLHAEGHAAHWGPAAAYAAAAADGWRRALLAAAPDARR